MNPLKSRILTVVFLLLFFVGGMLVGTQIAESTPVTTNFDTDLDVAKIIEVYELVMSKHVHSEDINQEDLLDNALRGMLSDIDNGLTRFQTAEEFEAAQTTSMRGDYAGIGVVINMGDDGYTTIISPYKDTPADVAGLKPGDKIIGVEGENTFGWTLAELGDKVRGPVGSEVLLTILPANGDEAYEVSIVRDRIEPPVAGWEIVGDSMNIGHVNLNIFNDHSLEQLTEAIDQSIKAGAESIILDLRGNPGGMLSACLGIADLFLDQNKVIFITRDGEGVETVYTTEASAKYDLPITLLINKGSASASEVTTATLMENDRATSIGTNSYGKASMQYAYNLSDGDYLWVTTNTYLTPDGNNIDKVGIEPDVLIPDDILAADEDDPADLALQFAIDWVETNLSPLVMK